MRHVRYIFERLAVDIDFGDGAEVDILILEKYRKWDVPHSQFDQFVLLSGKPRVICKDGGQSRSIVSADSGLFDNIQRLDGRKDDRESKSQWDVPNDFNGHRTPKAADEDELDRLKEAQIELT